MNVEGFSGDILSIDLWFLFHRKCTQIKTEGVDSIPVGKSCIKKDLVNCIQMSLASLPVRDFSKGKVVTAEFWFYVAVSTWYNNTPHPPSVMKLSMVYHSRVGFAKWDPVTVSHVFSKYWHAIRTKEIWNVFIQNISLNVTSMWTVLTGC